MEKEKMSHSLSPKWGRNYETKNYYDLCYSYFSKHIEVCIKYSTSAPFKIVSLSNFIVDGTSVI